MMHPTDASHRIVLQRVQSDTDGPREYRTMAQLHPSPTAGHALLDSITVTDDLQMGEYESDLEGETDCPEGCYVEPDGHCPHGYMAAALWVLAQADALL
jgi:hypothetical protein